MEALSQYRDEFITDILNGTTNTKVPDSITSMVQARVESELDRKYPDEDVNTDEEYAHMKVGAWL